jgi:serine/threonine protein phosphatase 1
MNILVIGDVHGCYHTFKKLVDENFQPGEDLLVQLGDLIDRGNYSPETVRYARELQEEHKAVFLKGNHESLMIKNFREAEIPGWLAQGGFMTIAQYAFVERDVESDLQWFEKMPLFWENDAVFVSHAGISSLPANLFDESDPNGILWNRAPLKNIGQLQIIGHTPQLDGTPTYDKTANSWNIDTACVYGFNLTALRLSEKGEILKTISVKVLEEDIEKYF